MQSKAYCRLSVYTGFSTHIARLASYHLSGDNHDGGTALNRFSTLFAAPPRYARPRPGGDHLHPLSGQHHGGGNGACWRADRTLAPTLYRHLGGEPSAVSDSYFLARCPGRYRRPGNLEPVGTGQRPLLGLMGAGLRFLYCLPCLDYWSLWRGNQPAVT